MAWLSGFDKRIKLTIDHTKIDAALSHFPVTAQFGQLQVPYSLNKNCRRPGMQAIYDSTADKTFIVYTGVDTHPYITYYDHTNKMFGSSVKVGASSSEDQHHYPMLLIDSSGYLYVFYGAHDTTLRYAKSNNVRDISAWTDSALANATYATYPFPVEDDGGDIYVFYRRHDSGVDATYHRPLYFVKTADGGSNWSAATVAIENTDDDDLEEVYLGKIAHESAHESIPDRVHLIWTMAGGASHDQYHEDIHYAYFKFSDDHFYAADNTDLGVAINDAELEANTKIVDTGAADDKDTPYVNFVDYKTDGTPIIVYGDDVSGGWYYNEYDSGWGTPIKLVDYSGYGINDLTFEDSTIKVLIGHSGTLYEYSSEDGSTFSETALFSSPLAAGYITNHTSLARIFTRKNPSDYTNDGKMYLYPGHNIEIFDELTTNADFDKCAFTTSDEETQLYGDCELFNAGLKSAIYHYSKTGWEISSSAVTDSYFYYDGDASNNTDYISKSGSTAAQSVWDGNFKAVYHMNDVIVDYDTQYEATVEPDSDGWTLAGDDYSSVSSGILTIDTSANDTHLCYYYKTPDVDFDAGFYLKARIKISTDMNPVDDYYTIEIRDGTQNERVFIRIENGRIYWVYNDNQYDNASFDTTTDYVIYEIYVKGSTFWIYADGVQKATNTVDSQTVDDSIRFGDTATGSIAKAETDYVYYALGIASNPLLTILDSTSNNNDGTKKGAGEPVEAAGKVGQGQDFDGDDDYIDTTLATTDLPTNGDYTLELLLQADDTSTNQSLISDWENEDRSVLLRLSGNEIDFYVGSGIATLTPNAEFAFTDITNYHHIAATHDVSEKGLELFDNGVSQDTAIYTGTVGTSNNNIFLGSSADLGNPLNARLDEVRISSTIRIDAWLKATTNALYDTLLTYGSEELAGVTHALISTATIVTSITSALSRGVTETLISTSAIASSATSALSRGVKALTSTSNIAISITSSLSRGILQALTSTVNGIVSITSSLSRGITESLTSTANIVSSFTSRLTKIIDLVSASAIVVSITSSLSRGITEALNSISTIATSIIAKLNKFGNISLTSTSNITTSIAGRLTRIVKLLSTVNIISFIFGVSLGRGIKEALISTSTLTISITSILSKGIVQILISTINGAISTTGNLSRGTTELLTSTANITTSIIAKLNKFGNVILTSTSAITTSFSAKLTRIVDLLSTSAITISIVSALSRGVKETLTSTAIIVTSITSTLSRGITNTLTSTSNIVTSFTGSLSRGVKEALTSTVNIATSIASILDKGVASTLTSTVNIGTSIIAKLKAIYHWVKVSKDKVDWTKVDKEKDNWTLVNKEKGDWNKVDK